MEKPLLERVGVRYFERRSRAATAAKPSAEPVDAVHYLNPTERAGLLRVERGAITRAAIAGALSAGASAAAEIVANPSLPEGADVFSRAATAYWVILGGATLAAAVLEILYLYWDTLRSMHELARVAGLDLFSGAEEDSMLVDGLARAALELPNPVEGPLGIDARREASKWRLVAASVAYKAKVGVTNFLVKMLVRRMLGRVFVRSVVSTFVPFVAVPITAGWNAVVSWLILREGRLRAMGPSAAHALVEQLFAQAAGLTDAGRLAAVRAVAAAIVRTQDLHPNLLALLKEVTERAGDTGGAQLDDVTGFLSSLGGLAPNEQTLALRVLAVACIIDGRFTRREKRLWRDALEASGLPVDFGAVEALRVAFSRGDGQAEPLLETLVSTPIAL